jgi:hypothetical protein
MPAPTRYRCDKIENGANGNHRVYLDAILEDGDKSEVPASGTVSIQLDNTSSGYKFELNKEYFVEFNEVTAKTATLPKTAARA